MSKPGWREIPIGGLIEEAGNAAGYYTGDWRTYRPELDGEKCTNCLQCWIHCPDSSVQLREQTVSGFDYEHCKGCGICAQVCPVDAIQMRKEQA